MVVVWVVVLGGGGYGVATAGELADAGESVWMSTAFVGELVGGGGGGDVGVGGELSLPADVETLELSSVDQEDAFLELYGYWLGDGWLDGSRRAVSFSPMKVKDSDYLAALFLRLNLVGDRVVIADRPTMAAPKPGKRYESWVTQHVHHVVDARWWTWFASRYGHKYVHVNCLAMAMANTSALLPLRRPAKELVLSEEKERASQPIGRSVSHAVEFKQAHVQVIDGVETRKCHSPGCARGTEWLLLTEFYNRVRDGRLVIEKKCKRCMAANAARHHISKRAAAIKLYDETRAAQLEANPELKSDVPDAESVKSAKWFVPWVFDLSARQCRVLLAGVRMADGDSAKGVSSSIQIYTSSLRFAEEVVRVALAAGMTARMKKVLDVGDTCGYNQRGVQYVARHVAWAVCCSSHPKRTQPKIKRNHMTRSEWTGTVWCLTVPVDPPLIMVRKPGENHPVKSVNSAFGGTGAADGIIPLQQIAACTTAQGRQWVRLVADWTTEHFNSVCVYGDSVTGDTPVLLRDKTGAMYYRSIEDASDGDWVPHHEQQGKECAKAKLGAQVWSEAGWTPVHKVIRHKTNKAIVRVLTHTGMVQATTDHSLLTSTAEKITPNQVVIGTRLLHAPLPSALGTDTLHPDWAFALGLFLAEGSCGVPDKQVSTWWWKISNVNTPLCTRALAGLLTQYPTATFVMHASDLICPMEMKVLAAQFRSWFYDSREQKKVPDFIFACDTPSLQAFWDGHYAGENPHGNRGQLLSAGLFWIMQALGYPVSINARTNQPNIYRHTTTQGERELTDAVKRIEPVDFDGAQQFVYDLETESHHFAAGIGRMVVHNTDSVFLYFKDKVTDNDTETITGLSALIEPMLAQINALFPRQVKLDFEKVFKDLILLSKKRYIGDTVSPTGVPLDHLVRGCALVRRDSGPLVQAIYRTISDTMLRDSRQQTDVTLKAWEQELNLVISTYIRSIFERRRLDISEFVLSCGIARARTGYKQVGAHREPKHILLWDRVECRQDQMLNGVRVKSGTNVFAPGMRIEFVAIDTPVLPNEMLFTIDWDAHQQFVHSKSKLQVHYLEELDYYLQFKHVIKLNFLWYLESQMYNPLAELMHTVFKTPPERSVMEEQLVLHKLRKRVNHLLLTRSRPWVHDEQTGRIVARIEPPTARWTMLAYEHSRYWYVSKLKRVVGVSSQRMKLHEPYIGARRAVLDQICRALGQDEGWMAILPVRGEWRRGKYGVVIQTGCR